MAKWPRVSVTLQWHCDPTGRTGKAAVMFCRQHVHCGGTDASHSVEGSFRQPTNEWRFRTVFRLHLGDLQAKCYPRAGCTCLQETFTPASQVCCAPAPVVGGPVWPAARPSHPIVIERFQEAPQEHQVLQSVPASHHRTHLWITAKVSRLGTPPTMDPSPAPCYLQGLLSSWCWQ